MLTSRIFISHDHRDAHHLVNGILGAAYPPGLGCPAGRAVYGLGAGTAAPADAAAFGSQAPYPPAATSMDYFFRIEFKQKPIGNAY